MELEGLPFPCQPFHLPCHQAFDDLAAAEARGAGLFKKIGSVSKHKKGLAVSFMQRQPLAEGGSIDGW